MTPFYVVSNGTLRPQDLMPRMVNAFRDEDPDSYAELVIAPFSFIPQHALEDDEDPWWDTDDAEHKFQVLQEMLEEIATTVPYRYFGAVEGDGACIGFFPDLHAIHMEIHYGNLTRIDDPAELEDLDEDTQEAVHVNDHGNVTLYTRDNTGSWQLRWDTV